MRWVVGEVDERWNSVRCKKSARLDFSERGRLASYLVGIERFEVQLSDSQIGIGFRERGEEW